MRYKALAELVKISNAVGGDSSLVLGRFGDVSVKTAAALWLGKFRSAVLIYAGFSSGC